MRYVFDDATLPFVAPVLANIKERNSSTVIFAFVKPEEDKGSIYSYTLHFQKHDRSQSTPAAECGRHICIVTGLEANSEYKMWMRSCYKGLCSLNSEEASVSTTPAGKWLIYIYLLPCANKHVLCSTNVNLSG